MDLRTVGLALTLVASASQVVLASDCAVPSTAIWFRHMDRSVSVPSPDARWRFVSTGTGSPDDDASLRILSNTPHHIWHFGRLQRNGTAFWSEDSKWLILRDEYAADDTKIRLFDLNLSSPREIRGLDTRVKRHVLRHVPSGHSTLWITYPRICFLSGDTSRVLMRVDAPFAPDTGGSGTDMVIDLSIELAKGKITEVAVRRNNGPLPKAF